MKKTYIFFIFLIVVLSFGVCVFAEDAPEIYNKGNKVEIENSLIYQDGQYFIHSDDLKKLNLSYSYDDATNKGEITTNDVFGIEKKVLFALEYQMPHFSGLPGDIIGIEPVLSEDGVYDFIESNGTGFYIDEYGNIVKDGDVITEETPNNEEPDKIYNYTMTINSYQKRAVVEVGKKGWIYDDLLSLPEVLNYSAIKLNGAYYFPINFIGEKMSHKYDFDGEKFELYITGVNSVIVENTIHLSGVVAASDTGWQVNISFLEKKY